jgi:hypothetical protein
MSERFSSDHKRVSYFTNITLDVIRVVCITSTAYTNFTHHKPFCGRLCGLVVRVPGCRHRVLGFDSRRCQIFCVAVGLELGPLSPCEDK